MDLETVPIASLAPSLDQPASKRIRAIVTLIWPYSSSTRSAALLLADPDFRLRKSKGQVRVVLRGASARLVAESRIGIGDEVYLSLAGVQWREDTSVEDTVRTPGRNVDWALVFRRKLSAIIQRNGQLLGRIDVNSDTPSPEPEDDRYEDLDPNTPFRDPSKALPPPASSIFSKHGRLSGDSISLLPYNPFGGSTDRAAKRLRRSWGDVNSWKLSGRTPSPEHVAAPPDESGDLWEKGQPEELQSTPTQFVSAFRGIRQPPALWKTGPQPPRALVSEAPPTDESGESASPDEESESADHVELSADEESRHDSDIVNHEEEYSSPGSHESVTPQSRQATLPPHRESSDDLYDPPEIHGSQTQPIVLSDSDEEDESDKEHLSGSAPEPADRSSGLEGLPEPGEPTTETVPISIRSPELMLPPARRTQGESLKVSTGPMPSFSAGEPQAPATPQLQAVVSPSLPLPSPFPTGNDSREPALAGTSQLFPPPTLASSDQRPQTIRATLEAEKLLPIPGSSDRKGRSSSSSSYRKENGPFGEHFRAKAPFGLDGATFASEEAISDSPELNAKDLLSTFAPGYPDLDSLSAQGYLDANATLKELDEVFGTQDDAFPDPFTSSSFHQPLYPLLPDVSASTGAEDHVASAEIVGPRADIDSEAVQLTPPATAEQQYRLGQISSPELHPDADRSRQPVLPPTPTTSQVIFGSAYEVGLENAQMPPIPVQLQSPTPTRRAQDTVDKQDVSVAPIDDTLFVPDWERAEQVRAGEKTEEVTTIDKPTAADDAHRLQIKGLRTSLSYYIPLHPTYLRPYLNIMSQPMVSSQDALVDVIAVVTAPPSTPKRATAGPKDWHLVMSIARLESWMLRAAAGESEMPRGEVQVQCFAPGKRGLDLLPAADVGDVVLLRDFSVQSQKGHIRLLNRTHGSAWCVWRFQTANGARPQRPRSTIAFPIEEVKGAPVEIGPDERDEALRLRAWWEESVKPAMAHNGYHI